MMKLWENAHLGYYYQQECTFNKTEMTRVSLETIREFKGSLRGYYGDAEGSVD